MDESEFLSTRFEAHRTRLRGVAFRMLGSRSEAEDAVQETWLKLRRAGDTGIDNLGGWLTTVVSRTCLDMLRSRKSRREDPAGRLAPEPVVDSEDAIYPEHETLRVDSVGQALQVVLQTLPPAERVAFVLHDMFDVPFDDIAVIVGRTVVATRQLASRARRRVDGVTAIGDAAAAPDLSSQRAVVDAFLTAARGGDLQGLLALLAPDVVMQADAEAVRRGGKPDLRGADAVARNFLGRAQAARPAVIDGTLGLAVILEGKLHVVLCLTIAGGRIAEISAVAEPEHVAELDMTVLEERGSGADG